jgi:hypothetical protein
MKKAVGKNDIGLIAGILFAAALMLAVRCLALQTDRPQLEILVRNRRFGIYDLDRDQEIKIGKTNICEIRGGRVRMKEASCPDHLCLEFLPIDESGGSIICLPNQVILHIVNARPDTAKGDSKGNSGGAAGGGSTHVGKDDGKDDGVISLSEVVERDAGRQKRENTDPAERGKTKQTENGQQTEDGQQKDDPGRDAKKKTSGETRPDTIAG